MEFDLDKALEDVPAHVEEQATAAPSKADKKSSGAMGELPSEGKKLQHFTKLRPKRNKKTHSSKVPVGVPIIRSMAALNEFGWES